MLNTIIPDVKKHFFLDRTLFFFYLQFSIIQNRRAIEIIISLSEGDNFFMHADRRATQNLRGFE